MNQTQKKHLLVIPNDFDLRLKSPVTDTFHVGNLSFL